MSTQSSKTTKSPSHYSVGMFSAGEARCDRWQDLAHAAQALVAQSSSGHSTKETLATVEVLLEPLDVLETFRAYPGEAMMSALKEALGRSDYSGFSRLTNRIAKAIITGSYRRSVNAWKLGEEGEAERNDRLMKDYFDTGDLTKPYFEVLIVSDDPTPEQVRQGRAELRQLRRPEDPFVYETITVPSFEDGVAAALLNADVQAVVIKDNFRFRSQFNAPLLRAYLEQHLSGNPATWSRRITEWLSRVPSERSARSWMSISSWTARWKRWRAISTPKTSGAFFTESKTSWRSTWLSWKESISDMTRRISTI